MFRSRLICSVEDGGGGDGGGGGSAFSSEQREELTKIINGASSTHATRMQKVFDQKLEEQASSFSSMLTEQFAKFGNANPTPPDGDKKKKSSGDSAVDQRLEEMEREHQARMKEYENRQKQIESERQSERETMLRSEERTKLKDALVAKGVDPTRARAAVAVLHTEDKRIRRDKDGSIVFEFQRDGYRDQKSLKEGVDEWLSTDEGKHYAPARTPGGSGAQPGQASAQRNGRKLSKEEQKRQAKRELMQAIIMDGQR
jgi:hypothetical protein